MAEGIRVRHSRSCRSRGGEKGNCKPVVRGARLPAPRG